MKQYLLLLLSSLALTACGVRGDPRPPAAPTELGRGYPSFKSPKNRLTPIPLPSKAEIEADEKKEQEEDEK